MLSVVGLQIHNEAIPLPFKGSHPDGDKSKVVYCHNSDASNVCGMVRAFKTVCQCTTGKLDTVLVTALNTHWMYRIVMQDHPCPILMGKC